MGCENLLPSNAFQICGLSIDEEERRYESYTSDIFYPGDLEISKIGSPFVRVKNIQVDSVSLTQITTKTKVTFRRTWQHIQRKRTGTYTFLFVRRGQYRCVRSEGQTIAHSGFFILTPSDVPFFGEIKPDERGIHESIQINLPFHLLRKYVNMDYPHIDALPANTGDGALAECIISHLIARQDQIPPEVARSSMATCVAALGAALRTTQGPRENAHKKISDRRMGDFESFIRCHLAEKDLSLSSLAARFDLSKRYICHLFKAHDASFSDLVWDIRLKAASDWLRSPTMRNCRISEISEMTGFKSVAHFSRKFHRVFGTTPSEYRKAASLPTA